MQTTTHDHNTIPFRWIARTGLHNTSWRLDTQLIPIAVFLSRWNNPDEHEGEWCVRIGEDTVYLSQDSTLLSAQNYAVHRLMAQMKMEISRLKRLIG